MPGQPRKKIVKEVDRIDLTDLLGITGGDSVPVTFNGVDADIRTSYSGEEAVLFGHYAAGNLFGAMFDLVVDGGNGSALWDKISELNPAHASKVINAIVSHTGLFEGELVAPLPASVSGMAGASVSQDSDTTTV